MIRFHYHKALQPRTFGRVRIETGEQLCHVLSDAASWRRRLSELQKWAEARKIPLGWIQPGWASAESVPHLDLFATMLRHCGKLAEALDDLSFVALVRRLEVPQDKGKEG